jgi:CheY-like chemotaxis protein
MRRILVIDDDRSICVAIESSLQRQNCAVVLANNSPLACETFDMSEFDLVMVDIFMPDMDGLEVIKVLRERAPSMPIVAMSGYRVRGAISPGPDFLEMATKLGANHRLRKPFGPRQLRAAINSCLPGAHT